MSPDLLGRALLLELQGDVLLLLDALQCSHGDVAVLHDKPH
jgi:hypothetical protein